MRPLRVMHVAVAGDIGGAERLLVDLATRRELTGADHEVALMTPNPSLVAYFADAGLTIHDRGRAVRESPLAFLRTAFGPADLEWLSALLVDRRIDVVHTHTVGSHVLGTRAARRVGIPQVRTEHHVTHYRDLSTSPFTRWAAARTDRLVAVSDYVLGVLRRTAPGVARNAVVVRNGVDAAYWSPRPRSDDTFRVAVVCRLTAWKRVRIVVRAAASAGVELWVVGDGEERARLEALARRCGGVVRFWGRQPDPRPYVAACEATVSASDGEPLGLSLLESMAMERPVIAFAEGGIPEIVEDGTSGVLVGESTWVALAQALARARRDRAGLGRMGATAREFVLARCTIDRTCEGYALVYRTLVTGQCSARTRCRIEPDPEHT
jgi:glycosyltransferase involved in cell wall biosynthesis